MSLEPKDWGIGMTLCIAAISRRDHEIVTATDFMLSNENMSIDTQMLKTQPLPTSGKLWSVMFAGDPSVSAWVQHRAAQQLADKPGYIDTVGKAYESAFREELQRKIEGELLSPFGLDRDKFLREGRGYFGDEEFSRLVYQINATKLDTDFLVAGFDEGHGKMAHIFSVSDPGIWTIRDAQSFFTIGSGNMLALASLISSYEEQLSVVDLIYRICEAKFSGESALGVGKKTFIETIDSNGNRRVLKPEDVERIRSVWRKEKRPTPDQARTIIMQELAATEWRQEGIAHKQP